MHDADNTFIGRRTWCQRLSVLAATVACPVARAQTGASRTVRIVVPTAPGGSVDSAARLLADALNQTDTERFIVENRAGAGGAIGIQDAREHAEQGSIGHAACRGGQRTECG